ncbi:TPA: ead/Ea22-like family protein [Escherichia coli]|nr:ead/Ea22-like family protein [Escherichia coli]
MSKIDYQALRGAAEAIKIAATPQKLLAFRMKVTPQVVLELLDELEIKSKRINELIKGGENAKYVTEIFRLEKERMALAAENAALKQSEKEFNNFCRQEYYGWEDNFTETPATDAFLAEVRAQGVEMFADHMLYPDLDDTIRDFAAQLRKGGNQ